MGFFIVTAEGDLMETQAMLNVCRALTVQAEWPKL